MAELQTIARPYAEAAFDLARESNALPAWSQALKYAADIAGDAGMKTALDSPKLEAAAKETLFLSVAGDNLSAEARSFIRVLIEADRIAVLPEISTLFEARKNAVENVALAQIESAVALTDDQLQSLKGALARHFGKTIEATVSVNPALIGGARITVGDRVIDGSVQGKLTTMANDLSA
jgi:F-type H+-transporting ATPase subunit delta